MTCWLSEESCGLGLTAANPVTSALRFCPHAFLHYLLANPQVNQLKLFAGLEALRLLTRESIERIVARRKQTVGYSFTLKRHLLRYLVLEPERLDQYRPPHPPGAAPPRPAPNAGPRGRGP